MTEVLAVKHWRESPSFDEQDRALLAFCEKLTFEPGLLTAADLQSLRAVGYSERQILDIVLICGYRHFIARIADGVGIELDPVMQAVPDIVKTYSYEDVSGESPLTVAHRRNTGIPGKNVVLSPSEYITQQFLLLMPLTAPVWIAGLWFFFFDKVGAQYRVLGIAYLVTLVLMIVLKG